ncbi:hypothetical protein [Actomonas aquatica]|uniref:Antitoxin Xre/MbcA/ParS-like toxin-binding domain-containing protein n=1 Tax=Actomonas aquatica TaxID=2866162 RepID=A0ABZ1C238_9BACT|nr:hypothetical protein [Opitutus sp. WL0086]WRQ85737.1 hypothetical protein K1X11_013075 [Opitutus sp. WL0086]
MNTDFSVCRDTSSGMLDPGKVAALFRYSLDELAALLKVSPTELIGQSDSARIQTLLEPFDQVARYLGWCRDKPERFQAWLADPNPDFASIGNVQPSPRKLLEMGHIKIVATYVRNRCLGLPS